MQMDPFSIDFTPNHLHMIICSCPEQEMALLKCISKEARRNEQIVSLTKQQSLTALNSCEITVKEHLNRAKCFYAPLNNSNSDIDLILKKFGWKGTERLPHPRRPGIPDLFHVMLASGVEAMGRPHFLLLNNPLLTLEPSERLLLFDVLSGLAEALQIKVVISYSLGYRDFCDIPTNSDFIHYLFFSSKRLIFSGLRLKDYLLEKVGVGEERINSVISTLVKKDFETAQILYYHEDLMKRLSSPAFTQSDYNTDSMCAMASDLQVIPNVSFLQTFSITFTVRVKYEIREWSVLISTISMLSIVFLLTMFVFFQIPNSQQDNKFSLFNGLFYFTTVSVAAQTLFPLMIVGDRMVREYKSFQKRSNFSLFGLTLGHYFGSLAPVRLPVIMVLLIALYYVTGCRTDGFQYCIAFLANLLGLALNCASIGLFMSIIMVGLINGQVLFSVLLVFYVIFGQIRSTVDATWVLLWMQFVDPFFYSMQALMQVQFYNVNTINGKDVDTLMAEYAVDIIPYWADLLFLYGTTLIWLILTVIAYRIRFPNQIKK